MTLVMRKASGQQNGFEATRASTCPSVTLFLFCGHSNLTTHLAVLPPTYLIVFGIGAVFIGAIPAMMLLRLAIDAQAEALHLPV